MSQSVTNRPRVSQRVARLDTDVSVMCQRAYNMLHNNCHIDFLSSLSIKSCRLIDQLIAEAILFTCVTVPGRQTSRRSSVHALAAEFNYYK